jgi:transaldolase
MENKLKQIAAFGQSIWLDYIRRDLIAGGGLLRMIGADGLSGMTSNPAIFEKAIGESQEYDQAIRTLGAAGMDAQGIYEALSQEDVRNAADVFRPLYESTNGGDGYVSLEVDPHLARDSAGTVEEARRLWKALDRPNVLIKVPATAEGLAAIRQLTEEGISTNATLLFGLARYRQVAQAYLAGLSARVTRGQPVRQVASVASFFLSRIDTLVDPQLEALAAQGGKIEIMARQAQGQVSLASARLAYHSYLEMFGPGPLLHLARAGARPQRLLWASTASKNAAFSDVKYVDALIGPETVNTLTLETLDAYRDHGEPAARLAQGLELARRVFENLQALGIRMAEVALGLEEAGVAKFLQPFDNLLTALGQRA